MTLTWFRTSFFSSPSNNLNLKVYAPNGSLVGQSNMSAANSYDRVAFPASATGPYRAVVDGSFSGNVDYAIAGAGQAKPPQKPVLTAINPDKVRAAAA